MRAGGGGSCSDPAAVPSAPSTMDSSDRLHARRCLRPSEISSVKKCAAQVDDSIVSGLLLPAIQRDENKRHS
jgi:hypothetical protein